MFASVLSYAFQDEGVPELLSKLSIGNATINRRILNAAAAWCKHTPSSLGSTDNLVFYRMNQARAPEVHTTGDFFANLYCLATVTVYTEV
jgi:hypothetical protein